MQRIEQLQQNMCVKSHKPNKQVDQEKQLKKNKTY